MSPSKSTACGKGKRQVAWHSMRSWVLSHWGQRGHLQPKSWNTERVPRCRRVRAGSQIWRGSARVTKINAMCQRGWALLADWVRGTGLRLGLGFILKAQLLRQEVASYDVEYFVLFNCKYFYHDLLLMKIVSSYRNLIF